jgi:hypothetical protein
MLMYIHCQQKEAWIGIDIIIEVSDWQWDRESMGRSVGTDTSEITLHGIAEGNYILGYDTVVVQKAYGFLILVCCCH